MRLRFPHRRFQAGIALLAATTAVGAPPAEDSSESATSAPATTAPTTQPPVTRPPAPAIVPVAPAGPIGRAWPGLPNDGHGLATLKRLVRRFDFEEAQIAPIEFPVEFQRHIAEDRGFPKFGRMRLTNDEAWAGEWSLKFELDGGSLSAEVPTGVLPVLPMADYVVSTMVKTANLRHARVRLTATLHDALGAPINDSRIETTGIRTGGQWERLSVRLPGDFADATHLRIQLELLQPRHLTAFLDPSRPALEDVTGTAWFDDVTVWHLPRLELAMTAPDNIVHQPDTPRIEVLVHDLSSDPLTATLRIEDYTGSLVHDETFPAPRGRLPTTIDLPLTRCGWYQAHLDVHGRDTLTGQRSITFLVLPEAEPAPVRTASALAVNVPDFIPERLTKAADLIPLLHVRGVVVRIWDERMSPDLADERFAATRDLVEELLRTDTDLTFSLDSVPSAIASHHGVDPKQVLEFLNQDPAHWRPWLDEMLINFGLRVRRWQLGGTEFPDAFWKPDLQSLATGAHDALAQFIPHPTTIIPFSAEQELLSSWSIPAVHVTIPHQLRPDTIGGYATPWRDGGGEEREVHTTFELLPLETYAPREQIIDLVLRGLYGWRAGIRQMAIDTPWHWEDGRISPEPASAAWRGLADALRGRHFAGELPLEDGVECWLLESRSSGDDALVIWTPQRTGDAPVETRLMLAEHEVQLVDMFGNRSTLAMEDGTHRIPVSELPVIIENIDLPLARFRAGFRIAPNEIESQRRVHEASIILENPWEIGISGTIRVRPPSDCELSPRTMPFVIRPKETLELPATVIFDRSAIAGIKRFDADVELVAGREYALRMHTNVSVGWSEIEHAATWSLAENVVTGAPELVVTQTVTNRGSRVLTLDTFLLGRGIGQSRRAISSLQPGATAVKNFRIPGAAGDWAGQLFRVGVSERGGIAQLNRQMRIPEFLAEDTPATADGTPP